MKKILIVDDNARNREFLRTLCEDYAEEKGLELTLLEADDGSEAVNICEKEPVDMVFMDIMMPVMDGIEATNIIRQNSNDIMVIAVSAAEDESYQNDILQAGAEDYITKPVISSVFLKRLENYIRIHSLRREHRLQEQFDIDAVNLYTKNVNSFLLTFRIRNEDCLAQFWERMLILDAISNTNERFSELIRIVYSVGSVLLKKDFMFSIYVEESKGYHYFTLNRMNLLSAESISAKVARNYPGGEFKLQDSLLSFRLPRSETADNTVDAAAEPVSTAAATEELPAETAAEPVPQLPAENQPLVTFDFITDDQLLELQSMASRLQSSMLYLSNAAMSEEEVLEMVHYIRTIGDILGVYNEVCLVGDTVEALAGAIEENVVIFQERAGEFVELFSAFTRDLNFWIDALFVSGAPSLNFLDDSIVSNAHMIQGFLLQEETENQDLDDIFDF